MRITQKGQITIPENIRQKYGFLPYSNINFVEENGKVYIVAARDQLRGSKIVAHLRGTATVRMSTDEILELTRGKDK
jgi:bifunctional DNA-binding transcriptional regulator/antitoxin component of YhaV-PrlF toxin-antitoxin module